MTIPPRLFSMTAAGEYLGGISRVTMWRLIKAGELRAIKIGSRTMFTREDLDAYIEATKAEAVAG